jgi:S-DNA-T family DNA segregation ATPase FtsK/SpoIIIE
MSYHKFNAPHLVKNSKAELKHQFYWSPRFYIYIGALVLGVLAVIFTLAISASIYRVPDMSSPLGNFFADSYGILSFFIPAYFIFAAIILLDTTFRPRRLFLLNSIIFPFLTLAVSFSFMRDFDFYSGESQFLYIIGKNGFSFITVAFTMLECFVIISLASLFFPATRSTRKAPAGKTRYSANTNTTASNQNEVKILRIPLYKKETIPVLQEEAQEEALESINSEDAALPESSLLDSSLDTLDLKLSSLRSGIGTIDLEVDKLDENIKTLHSEFDDITSSGIVAELDDRDDADELPELEELEEIEELGEIEDAELIGAIKTASAPDIECIIDEAEAVAAKKTEEALRKQNELQSKKKSFSLKLPNRYSIPVEDVLTEYADNQYWIIDEATRQSARALTETLNEFNIQAEVTGIRKGPVITSFEILPSPGVKLSKIVNLQDNIALRLAAESVRIVAPIPGKHAVGIEIPNKKRSIVSFREIIEGELQKEGGKKAEIPVVLGKNITGEAITVDLATMPHLLIAGSTGSGKSVCVNTLILSILYQCTPAQCKLILIDPKIVELKLYNDIGHLLTPVITEPKRAFQALQYCIYEMERRYACLDSIGVRDIKTYNRRIKERHIAAEHIPYIVIVIDEFADLMATTGKELESTVARLAAMSRAVGIHLVLATQRPSIDVITGLIKSNIPSRVAFMVASMMDSRIIIDSAGAEKLLGKGDMLYSGITSPFPIRLQGAFVSEDEVERVVEQVRRFGEPEYIDEEIFFDEEEDASQLTFEEGDDPLYEKAMEVIVQQGKASASYIQRRLKIGYNRAARLVEEMEHRGVVGPAQGSRPRELLRAV